MNGNISIFGFPGYFLPPLKAANDGWNLPDGFIWSGRMKPIKCEDPELGKVTS